MPPNPITIFLKVKHKTSTQKKYQTRNCQKKHFAKRDDMQVPKRLQYIGIGYTSTESQIKVSQEQHQHAQKNYKGIEILLLYYSRNNLL